MTDLRILAFQLLDITNYAASVVNILNYTIFYVCLVVLIVVSDTVKIKSLCLLLVVMGSL